MMSIAGITSISLSWLTLGSPQRSCGRLPVVRELKRNRDVLGLAQVLDHQLQGVLVLADHSQLVALDPHLHLRGDVLDALAKVAGDLIGDAGIKVHFDLSPALADGLWVVGLEQLWRQLAPRRLLTQNLQGRLRALFARRIDEDQLVLAVERRLRVFEVVPSAHLSAGLVDRVGELRRVELRDDVEGELSHSNA